MRPAPVDLPRLEQTRADLLTALQRKVELEVDGQRLQQQQEENERRLHDLQRQIKTIISVQPEGDGK